MEKKLERFTWFSGHCQRNSGYDLIHGRARTKGMCPLTRPVAQLYGMIYSLI